MIRPSPGRSCCRRQMRHANSSRALKAMPHARRARPLLQQALSPSAYEVVFVADGEAALRAYGQALRACNPFDLLILDCSMPRLSGIQTARRVRELGDEQVAIVFLTAHSGEITVDD